jgi:uncharacterized protein (TIGR02679 family)
VTPLPSLTSPEMAPVWEAIRDRLESRGLDNRGRVRLPPLPQQARLAMTTLLGRAPTTQVDLGLIERALIDLEVGSDLPAAMRNLGYAPSLERAQRRTERLRRTEALAAARGATRSWPEAWGDEWIDDVIRAGLLSRLDTQQAVTQVHSVRRVLDQLDESSPDRSISRTDLAALVLGSSHALDAGTALEAMMSRALTRKYTDCEAGEDVWELAGVHTDQVSGAALTWALPILPTSGLHALAAAAARARVPVHLTRSALTAHPVHVKAGTTVLVAENPRVVEAAAQWGSTCPVITTNGNPSAAVRLLLDQLLDSSAHLLYHGDFDAPGLAICARMQQIGLHPWRMDTDNYKSAVAAALADGVELPAETRPVGSTPWDPSLQVALTETGRIVHEERLLNDLLEVD